MITKDTFQFLTDLSENNDREWFADNKKRFEKEQKEAKSFFMAVETGLKATDNIEKVKVFRIYRDVRFSKNKLPYKNNFSAGYVRATASLRGGYYLHIENNASFVGGGFWEPNNEDLLRFRKELSLDATEFREIINTPDFKKYFKELKGDELKTAPRDFDKTHKNIDLIRKKQFLVTRTFTNQEVLSTNFHEEVVQTFNAMRPFFNYMTNVLTTNLNGESVL
jgi:uncharacterized protein (TIGR02453 family)